MKVLIITDVQHDFMPGSILPAPHANEIIPIINQLILKFEHVIATLDSHPPNHVSFAQTHNKKPGDVIEVGGQEQILWPVHCVQDSRGAHFARGLHQERIEAVFRKGSDVNVDSYSSFFDNGRRRSTGLEKYLRINKLHDLYFVGIATDYCVLYSVLDALALGFQATVIRDACRGIKLCSGDEKNAIEVMRANGARISLSKEFL